MTGASPTPTLTSIEEGGLVLEVAPESSAAYRVPGGGLVRSVRVRRQTQTTAIEHFMMAVVVFSVSAAVFGFAQVRWGAVDVLWLLRLCTAMAVAALVARWALVGARQEVTALHRPTTSGRLRVELRRFGGSRVVELDATEVGLELVPHSEMQLQWLWVRAPGFRARLPDPLPRAEARERVKAIERHLELGRA